MNLKKITAYFILISVIVILGYDGWVILQGGREVSISHQVIEWSYEMPAMVFLVGFLCGHLFWRMRDTKATRRISGGK